MAGLIQRVYKFFFARGFGAETVRYVVVGVMTTFVNYGLFELLYGLFGFDANVSNVASISASVVFAYVMNKRIVFRRRSGSRAALAAEFCKFVGSRLFTMALEVGAVFLFHSVLGHDARLGKVAALVIVVVANYLISKLIVFKG